MKRLFFAEITDTFGGEANYSWLARHIIRAKSERGAINALSRRSGISWHSVIGNRYDSKSGATCVFLREYNKDTDSDCIRYASDDRKAGE